MNDMKREKPKGSGRQPLYGEGEEVKRIMIPIPKSKEAEVREKIEKVLNAYKPKQRTKS